MEKNINESSFLKNMGIEQKMPPRGDVLRKKVKEAIANIDYNIELPKIAHLFNGISYDLPPVHLDPPYRREEDR